MKKRRRNEENFNRQTGKQHWTAVQVTSVTKPINMFRATKWNPVVIVQKMWKANVDLWGFHTVSDIEKENTIFGFWKLPDHITQNVFIS